MKNEDIKKLVSIFNALNTIAVKGQDVYTMAGVFNVINDIIKSENEGGDGT